MILSAGLGETFPFAVPIGVGLINASINLTRVLMKKNPKNLLFIGTAGSYGKYKEFQLLTSNRAANIEIGFLQNLSYSPILGEIRGAETNVSRGTLSKIVVNSSNFITADAEQAKLFLEYGLSIENMEFFAVLKTAEKFNIPALGLFCITNYCNKDAHENFFKNQREAKELLKKSTLSDFKDFL
ncbi:MAG: purine-nucleoside phosphorylase [Campylobacteraceae bacterium]|jgi:nucleoside phosphorylase|nr:purine-nucleoside phosphorylase [Campylobacteraceae bacterium]